MTEQRRSRGMLIGGIALLAAVAIAVSNDSDTDSAGDSRSSSDLAATAPSPGASADSADRGDGSGSSGSSGDSSSGSGSSGSGSSGSGSSGGGGSGDGAGGSAERGTPPGTAAGAAGGAGGTGAPFCGASRYIEEITVQEWASGDFRVSVWPTDEARHADDRDAASAEIWTAVRSCIGAPEPGVAESLQDQLRCHEFLALVPGSGSEQYATGDTFDVESWRPTPGRRRWISTRCGNTLGTDPAAASVRTYRPDGVPPRSAPTGEHA